MNFCTNSIIIHLPSAKNMNFFVIYIILMIDLKKGGYVMELFKDQKQAIRLTQTTTKSG